MRLEMHTMQWRFGRSFVFKIYWCVLFSDQWEYDVRDQTAQRWWRRRKIGWAIRDFLLFSLHFLHSSSESWRSHRLKNHSSFSSSRLPHHIQSHITSVSICPSKSNAANCIRNWFWKTIVSSNENAFRHGFWPQHIANEAVFSIRFSFSLHIGLRYSTKSCSVGISSLMPTEKKEMGNFFAICYATF